MSPTPVKNRFQGVLACLFLVAAFLVLAPNPVAAQDDCYPDGCGSTTTEPSDQPPTCGISLEAGPVGLEVVATVQNVPLGGTVRILVGGIEVARGTNSGVQSIVAMPSQGTGEVVTSFEIPDLDPGSYSVTAVGVGFTVTCGGGGFDVLGDSAQVGDGDGGGAKGALAFTGAQILGLVLLALILLAVGYVLVRRSRDRKLA